MADNQDLHEQMLINEQYLTVKQIGKGGFGVVWKAYDFSLRNFVAIKELLKDYSERKYVEMFYKEALIAKNIIHDNIVRVQHFWKGSNGSFYLLMDYVSGSDLETLIKKCNRSGARIPWELSVLICSGILKALDHANRLAKDPITGRPYGIVYRDISPGNVLISFEGGIKLSDFGIAKTADELSSGPRQRIVTGKYAYMSPEQLRADADIDHRSDIFSIGVVLYEMLSGLQLYGGDNATIKQHVLNTDFDPALLSGLDLPEDLIEIVVKSLQKNKDDRYDKAIEMFRDLRRLLRGKETEELTAELAEFAKKVLTDELSAEAGIKEFVKQFTLTDVKSNPEVQKVSCRDFIVGDSTEPSEPESAPAAEPAPVSPEPSRPAVEPKKTEPQQPVQPQKQEPSAAPAIEQKQQPPAEMPVPPMTEETPLIPREVEEMIKAKEPSEEVKRVQEKLNKGEKKPGIPVKKVEKEELREEKLVVPAKPAEEQKPAEKPKVSLEEKLRIEKAKMQEKERQERIKLEERARLERGNNGEEKGKTVFEEVGDWLVLKFKSYKKRIVQGVLALIVSAVLFAAIDVFTQLTPFGKSVYARLYPPDVVITTVPSGAMVSMKTREGKYVLTNVDSSYPVELRKIPPKSYILSATKEGFKTIERVVRIEDPAKGSGDRSQQRIELKFDFTLSINSEPPDAEVFIDGNKSKNTPWKGDLTSGEHTVKLSAAGFEELGSLAKEVKEGQCNIDFTKPSIGDIFSGADPKYWSYEMKTENGETIFSLTGRLFKKITINSNPKNAVVHLFNESQPRGNTPLTVTLKSGEYKIRFMDPEGRYEEAIRTLTVNKDSGNSLFVNMNKWVTFKAHIKDHPEKTFNGKLRLASDSFTTVKDISSDKPVRLALPVATYKVSIEGPDELKPFVRKVNIAEESSVSGELEYLNAKLRVVIKDSITETPVGDAFIWIRNQLAGKTDRAGVWENIVQLGTSTVRVVANGYEEQSFEKRFEPGKNEQLFVSMKEAEAVVVDTPTVKPLPLQKPIPAPAVTRPSKPVSVSPIARPSPASPNLSDTRGVIICPYCKKEYFVGPKKLRFCTSCGRPLK